MAQVQYDYSKRFQLHVIDNTGFDTLLCSKSTLQDAAMQKSCYPMPRARFYVFDRLTGNKCSVNKALHPDVIFQPMP